MTKSKYEYLKQLNAVEFHQNAKLLSWDDLLDAINYLKNLDDYQQYEPKIEYLEAVMKQRTRK